MKKKSNILIISIIIAICTMGCTKEKKTDLSIFAGAGLIKPLTDLITNFEKKNNIKTKVHYGSSGEIFGMVAAGQYCDILIPGAEKYTDDALKNKWVTKESIKKIVKHIPIIIVPKGNPGKIKNLNDLVKPGIKVALGDQKGPAIGRVTKKLLKKNKLWKKIQKNIVVKGPTVNQLLIYPALRQVDAAIVWRDITAWAEDKGKIQSIEISPKKNVIMTIPTAITTKCKNVSLAQKFNSYITSAEGLKIWKKWGFDSWKK